MQHCTTQLPCTAAKSSDAESVCGVYAGYCETHRMVSLVAALPEFESIEMDCGV
jgi:hypothetical protein